VWNNRISDPLRELDGVLNSMIDLLSTDIYVQFTKSMFSLFYFIFRRILNSHHLFFLNCCMLTALGTIITYCLMDTDKIKYSKNNRGFFIVPPEWIIEPKDVNVVRDDQAEVNCSASGHPKPTIKWKKGSSNQYTYYSWFTFMHGNNYNYLYNFRQGFGSV